MKINGSSKKSKVNYIVFAAKVILCAAILFWLLKSGRLGFDIINALNSNNLVFMLAVFFLNIGQALIVSTRWYVLQKVRNIQLPWLECARLNFLSNFFSACLPGNSGGELIKSYYISQYFPGKRVEAITIIIFNLFLGFLTLASMALIAILLKLLISNTLVTYYAFIIPGLIFLMLSFIFLFLFSTKVYTSIYLHKCLKKIPFGVWIKRAYDEAHAFKSHKIVLVNAIVLSFVAHTLQILSFSIIGKMLSDNLGLGIYFIVTPIIFFSNLLPITPGGLGVGEYISSILFNASGSAVGANVMLVFRFLIILLAIVTGLPAYLISPNEPLGRC